MRWRHAVFAITVLCLSVGETSRAAQYPAGSSVAPKLSPPRTIDGKPDLQGLWDFRTLTPLERPAELGDKAALTPEEAAEYEKRTVENRNVDKNRDRTTSRGMVNGAEATVDIALAYNDFWWDRGTTLVGGRRTSLIVDPPDGRIPPLTAEGAARLAELDGRMQRLAEGPEDRSIFERCIAGHTAGPPLTPAAYNNNVQIVQTPQFVALLNEMIHDTRIVPLDGRPHGAIRQVTGTSRGHWQGDTLVVETKNFHGSTAFRGSSPNLHLIERLSLLGADTLAYEYTVTDATTWTRPWTARLTMRRSRDQIYEYACHEGNYGLMNILKGARAAEGAAAARPSR